MQIAALHDIRVHYAEAGDPDGAPVVFANSLGTDLRLWDAVLPLLPPGLRLIRYDKRGHGLTDATPAPYGMGTLVAPTWVLTAGHTADLFAPGSAYPVDLANH